MKLIIIIIIASLFRLWGVNWDHDWHLHPDERFLTMVAQKLTWPKTFFEYLNTPISPLNPHNHDFGFYVYGTYPVIFVKYVAESLGKGDYNGLTIVGRYLSAFVDLGTLLFVYLITSRLFPNKRTALFAAIFYGLSVLPIQLSHFFAVDPYLVMFLTVSFYFLIVLITSPPHPLRTPLISLFLGLAFGLAVSAKISGIFFLPIIGLGLLIFLLRYRQFASTLFSGLTFSLITYLTLRLAQPFLFASPDLLSFNLNPEVIADWRELQSLSTPETWFPPATMWINTLPYIFPLENIVYWGLGVPLGIICIISVFYVLIKYRRSLVVLVAIWIVVLFAYQGIQFGKPMRYFYPLYPFMAITSAIFVSDQVSKLKSSKLWSVVVVFIIAIWPLAFVSIYSRPHSRVTASEWMLKNIPSGSTVSCEYWDDCLPLGYNFPYQFAQFNLYDPDSPQKWQEMETNLRKVDYIILSSNRLYGSISSVPERFPQTSVFYKLLFDGSLGFTKFAEFTSRPNIPIPRFQLCLTPPFVSYGKVSLASQECPLSGITFVDDYSDETFTVYDHPKVVIFQKTSSPPPSLINEIKSI